MVTNKKDVKKTDSEKAGKGEESQDEPPMIVKGELCPFCHEKKLTLLEQEKDIPYFGKAYLFGMDCEGCGYHKADLEADEEREPCKYVLDIDSEDDMKIRVVKSSNATIKIPHIGSIEPGEAANGYVTNVEGILQRLKKIVENIKEESDDDAEKKKAKNIIKKLTRIMWGQEKVKMTLEDPSGNSAIISDKAVKSKMKK